MSWLVTSNCGAFAHAHAARRRQAASLRSATVKTDNAAIGSVTSAFLTSSNPLKLDDAAKYSCSLHLVQHSGKRRLQTERLLDFVSAHVGVLAVFKEARALVLAHELNERGSISLPVL